ncbi:hypothetical protein AWB67_03525 [Caballeronia terrestris]|uniref:Lysine-specific metallo-endopeptidase domain-containing protein n=2 Tax=Caballeronia terrestris TaxID=1226301 RepID=A0A158J8V0_9BURK|nr:hypothetical protein AWB67_03525 [Caballeronia terrestris]
MSPGEKTDYMLGSRSLPDSPTPVHLRNVDPSYGNTKLPFKTYLDNVKYKEGKDRTDQLPQQDNNYLYKTEMGLAEPNSTREETVYMNLGLQSPKSEQGKAPDFKGFSDADRTKLTSAYEHTTQLVKATLDDFDKNGPNSSAFKKWFGGEHSDKILGDNFDKVKNTVSNMYAALKNEHFTFNNKWQPPSNSQKSEERGSNQVDGDVNRTAYGNASTQIDLYRGATSPGDVNGKLNPAHNQTEGAIAGLLTQLRYVGNTHDEANTVKSASHIADNWRNSMNNAHNYAYMIQEADIPEGKRDNELLTPRLTNPGPEPQTPVHLQTINPQYENTFLPTYSYNFNNFSKSNDAESIPQQKETDALYKMPASITRPGQTQRENVYVNMSLQSKAEDRGKGPTFKDFSEPQQVKLKDAYNHLVDLSQKALDDLNTNGRKSAAFKKWFGGEHSDRSYGDNLDKVRNVLTNMNTALKNEKFEFVSQPDLSDKKAKAQATPDTYGSDANTVYVNPDVVDSSLIHNDLEATIAHELTHIRYIGNTSDHQYTQTSASDLALHDWAAAMDNAPNYEYLIQEADQPLPEQWSTTTPNNNVPVDEDS